MGRVDFPGANLGVFLAKKKEKRFEDEGKGLGESAPDVNPADFETFSSSDAQGGSEEIDLSPATSSIAVVASSADIVEAEPAAIEIETTKSRYSRRDSLRGEVFDEPEPAAMLTADRLLDDSAKFRPSPESGWRKFAYYLTLKLWNPGDSPKVKARKAMDARIGAVLEGGTKFIPVLTRKGGVGKTTISTLLGMALAQVREDRVIAIDANPDRGTLAERVSKSTRFTVRDVVNRAAAIDGFSEFSNMVSRDETRLDVLASDADPMLSEAFNEGDYNVVADMAARYYSIVITDCGTGIVHSVMRPTLQRASSIVIVSGGSVDEARLASETLTWLEANGYGELVRNSVVALNTATQATLLVKLDEIEQHFKTRVRSVIRIPYDPALAAGSVIKFNELKKQTRDAARDLAAEVIGSIVTPQ
jgi:MinD-like ATPase involved in chromosome partitioning or flagellar assembly